MCTTDRGHRVGRRVIIVLTRFRIPLRNYLGSFGLITLNCASQSVLDHAVTQVYTIRIRRTQRTATIRVHGFLHAVHFRRKYFEDNGYVIDLVKMLDGRG